MTKQVFIATVAGTALAVMVCGVTRPAGAQIPTDGPVMKPSCAVTTAELWPPNHQLTDVGLSVTNCSSSNYCTIKVYSNQMDLETSSGDFSPDAKSPNPNQPPLCLRAERDGIDHPDGRVYLIIVKSGPNCDCCTVEVSHDRSDTSEMTVDTQANAAQTYCMTNCMAPPGYFQVGVGPVVGPKQSCN